MQTHNTCGESRNLTELVREVRTSGILDRLNALTHTAAQLVLHVLVRTGSEIVELHPAGERQNLSQFCQIFRSSAEGRQRCRSCRGRVAAGACVRGVSDYECFEGVTVLAAPATRRDGSRSSRLVVATSMVGRNSHYQGWQEACARAAGLGLDRRQFRQAYDTLPVFSSENLRVVTGVVELAAAILGDCEERVHEDWASGGESGPSPARGIRPAPSTQLEPDLPVAGGRTGSLVVDGVVAMVRRDPALPHSVAAMARAASVTPNHLSMLFHKHTGKTFREFLMEERISRAQALLRYPHLSVADVARQSGFDDPAYFSRRFRLVTGLSPSQWRNGHGLCGPCHG